MSVLGAVLVGVGCSYLGFLKGNEGRKLARLVGVVAQSLGEIERELVEKKTPLPELLKQLSVRYPLLSVFYASCYEGISGHRGVLFQEIWDHSLQNTEGLPNILCHELSPLGGVLGQYQKEVQSVAITAVIERLQRMQLEIEEENRRLRQVYPTLGTALGLFLVVLFL